MDITTAIPIILTIVALEALLSADNAMVLAVIVRPLPPALRPRAMMIGLVGALCFRAVAILLASSLIKFWWIEVLGGLYLVYLMVKHLLALRSGDSDHDHIPDAEEKPRSFWNAVTQLLIVDLAFSIDSILVVVAVTREYSLILAGAFTGMILIWIAAGYLVKLLDRYPRLETVAFTLVGWAGIKLVLEGWSNYAEKIAHREEWTFHLSQNFFLLVTGLIFVIGTTIAILIDRKKSKS